MADYALTEIRFGSKGVRNPDGTYTEEEAAKVIPQGSEISSGDFSDEELESLKASGSIGSPEELIVNLGSTASILQREDSVSLTNVPPQATPDEGKVGDEDDIAKALDAATNQVDRAEDKGSNAAEDSKAATSGTTTKKTTSK